MIYQQTLKYLESFINYEKIPTWFYKQSLKLERIEGFLDSINNPHKSLKCIHIAGTKGKGSTCAFIAYILREAGFSVGLYTSPHLSDFRERIRILNDRRSTIDACLPVGRNKEFEGMISKNALINLIKKLKPKIEKYNKNSKYGKLSFFEVYTSLAFEYFKEKKVDFAILETGLGGRLDATNVVNALICAITPISYEHTQQLGNTLTEIAGEKAGIIKNRRPCLAGSQASFVAREPSIVISAPQEEEVREVIRNRCQKVNTILYEVGKDIIYKKNSSGFNLRGIFAEYKNLKIPLLGEHQLINASVSVGVIEALRNYNIKINYKAIKNGLFKTKWPGRCEVVSQKPQIVLDGAQNVASGSVLKKAIKENFSATKIGEISPIAKAIGGQYKKLILVLGISKDKDIKGICNELDDLADIIIATKANNPRAVNPKEIAKYFKNKPTCITNSVKEAKRKAIKLAKKQDLILVTGSLFVVGEFRDAAK